MLSWMLEGTFDPKGIYPGIRDDHEVVVPIEGYRIVWGVAEDVHAANPPTLTE